MRVQLLRCLDGLRKKGTQVTVTEIKPYEELKARLAEEFELEKARKPSFTENSRTTFDLRYSVKNEAGELSEDPREAIWRVNSNVSSITPLYSGYQGTTEPAEVDRDTVPFPLKQAVRQYNWLLKQDRVHCSFEELMTHGVDQWIERAHTYQEMATSWDHVFNSPTWTGAGTGLMQLAACFVLPISDDLGRGRSSIFETLKVAALIQQTGGGNGFSFSALRPSGSLVRRSMGKATGPMGFLEVYNAAFGVIAQGGSRRGANMGVLRVSHPDIRPFIQSKVVEGEIGNFNLSVAIEDAFMDAVERDGDWVLQWKLNSPTDDPVDYQLTETIRARELYDEIVKNAWVIGDPGNLFIDRANRDNPVPKLYVLEATNPCGEQWLPPYSNCCLGSIAVVNFVEWDEARGCYVMNWERLRQTIVLATEALDDVIDANAYVPEVPELEAAAQGERRIGLGQMGQADAMIKLGIRYGAADGLDFASQLTEFVRYHSMLTSIRRAKERGPFEWIEDSIYDPKLLRELGPGAEISGEMTDGSGRMYSSRLWQPPTPLVKHERDFGRPDCDWIVVTEGIMEHGIRNACQLTIAPTGTIGTVSAMEGYGCEPLFALIYERTVMQEGKDIKLYYLSPLFVEALQRAGIDDATQKKILDKVKETGSCQGIEEVPAEIQNVFVVSADVTGDEHVWTQAVIQRFVDNSISKTINLPKEATVEDVSAAYKLAYQLGCKGITVYRQGSREREVLATGKGDQTIDPDHWPFIEPMPLPGYVETVGLPTRTLRMPTPFGKLHGYLTELVEHPGRPFDTRLQFGKAGNDKAADIEAIGRLISLCFRAGINVKDVVDQLEGIGGQSQIGFRDRKVRSSPDAIAKTLKRLYMPEEWAADYALDTPTNGSAPTVVAEPAAVSKPRGDLCPECKNYSVVHIQGCKYCKRELGGCGKQLNCD